MFRIFWKISFLLFVTIFVGSNSSECCSNCWDKCFNQDELMSCEQVSIFNIISKIRGTKIAQKIRGTAFLMDGSTSDATMWKYQQMLASLIALTEPVSNDCPGSCCNPFFLNVYQSGFAFYDWSWQCLDKCSVPKAIFSLTQSNQDSPNWVSGGCYLADHAMLYPYYHSCSSFVDPEHRMAIAFMNNDDQTDEFQSHCQSIPFRAAIRIGNPFPPNSYLDFAQEGVSPSLDPSHPGSLNILVQNNVLRERLINTPKAH